MDVNVSGRRVEVSEKLRRLSEEKVSRLSRVFEMERAEVVFSREKNPRIAEADICEVTLEGHGHHVRTKVAASDPFAAIDRAIAKVDPQLKKLKSRMQRISHGATRDSVRTIPDGEIPGDIEGVLDGDRDRHDPPKIVKSKRFAMMPMTPEEAMSRMDLLGHGFFFFTNIDTHRAAVVYQRDDGDVGLIDEAD